MTCSPNNIAIDIPSGPSGPAIPGFGIPSAIAAPKLNPFPGTDGYGVFPEDLVDIFNKLQFLIPPGALKPPLSWNGGKDAYDGLMKLMDQFFPFLMLYKFFMPVLNIIVCIIEVLCSISNPAKMIRAITRLFRTCIPEFLNMFPIFAVVVMLISLLQLLLTLIEYILSQVEKLVKAVLRNINALNKAFSEGNSASVLSIAKKLGSLLCIFQNVFVLLAVVGAVFQIIRDILKSGSSIPPCDSNNTTDDGCCTPDVCPAIVKQPYTRTTGTLQYLNQVSFLTSILLPPSLGGAFNFNVRSESWQIFDPNQLIAQQFINIIDAYDVTFSPKPVFFPTDVVYTASTSPRQAAYTMDLRMMYEPHAWGRVGVSKWIRFKNCIVTHVPNINLINYENAAESEPTGVLTIAGGLGYEDDGTTKLFGFAANGVTAISIQATLENFLHMQTVVSGAPDLRPTDGYSFFDMEYTFKPNIEVLIGKQLVTLGCAPEVELNKSFINTVFASDAAIKLQDLNNMKLPDTDAALECLNMALDGLRHNLTAEGVATFQATVEACMAGLKIDTLTALVNLIRTGVDPCTSGFELAPQIQFTSENIIVKVDLKDRNGLSLSTGMPQAVGDILSGDLKGYPTLGNLSAFHYDGYQYFTANLSSKDAGSGQLMLSFDSNMFCTNTIPSDITVPPSHDLRTLSYQFVYTSSGTNLNVAIGDQSDGKAPRRDEGDASRASGDFGDKDGT